MSLVFCILNMNFIILAGSDSTSQIIEGAIIFLIELFRDCSHIGQKQKAELRRMFGVYPEKSISEAFDIIKNCIEHLKEDIKDNFIRTGFPKVDEGLLIEEFGSKIKVVPPAPLDDSFFLIPINEDYELEDAFDKLSFKFENTRKGNVSELVIPKKTVPQQKKYNKDWLADSLQFSIQNNPSGISPAELSLTVCQLLKTSKLNDEIQNEVSVMIYTE